MANWKNEQEVVKNSSAVIISMLLGLVTPVIIGAILVLLSFIYIPLAIIITIVIVIILVLLMYLILTKIIDKRIETIEE